MHTAYVASSELLLLLNTYQAPMKSTSIVYRLLALCRPGATLMPDCHSALDGHNDFAEREPNICVGHSHVSVFSFWIPVSFPGRRRRPGAALT